MNEWLLIDKVDDFHYFKDIKSICDYLDLTKLKYLIKKLKLMIYCIN